LSKIKSCVHSGYCCTVAPCTHGESKENSTECIYLSEPNKKGERYCSKYEEIKRIESNFPQKMMGSGCSSTMFNTLRDNVIKNLKLKEKENES